jgi:hypothetical protein
LAAVSSARQRVVVEADRHRQHRLGDRLPRWCSAIRGLGQEVGAQLRDRVGLAVDLDHDGAVVAGPRG